MKQVKYSISLISVSLLLSFLVLLPYAIKFEHLFEDHQHISCNENTTHLHQKNFDCSLDAFSFSSFNFSFEIFIFSGSFIPFPKKNYHYETHHIVLNKWFVTLRGPPKVTV